MRFPLKEPMLVAAKLEGRHGTGSELSALLDFNAP
jgi:hypothetical protein